MSPYARAGVAAILAGALIFAARAGELVFGLPSDLVDGLFVALLGGGVVALGAAFWSLRTLTVVAATGVAVAGVLDVDPVHDLGLFAFEGAWVALGILLLRAGRYADDQPRSA